MKENKYYCRINGEVYNLKKIQDIMDEDPETLGGVKIDLALYDEYHLTDPTVHMLSQIIKETKEIPADYNEALKELQARNRKKYGIPERFRHSDDFCNDSDNVPYKNEELVKYTRENKYSCRIDGEVYDLKKIQDIMDEDPETLGGVKIDLALYDEYHLTDPTVHMLSQIIKETKEIPADYNEALGELQARNRKKYGIPERFRHSDDSNDKNSRNKGCPRCGSTNIAHSSHNLYSYKCRSCKHTWSQCPKCGGTNITSSMSWEPNGGYNLYYKVCSKCKHRWMEQG